MLESTMWTICEFQALDPKLSLAKQTIIEN